MGTRVGVPSKKENSMDVLEQLKARNQKSIFVREANRVFYACENPEDLPPGDSDPFEFKIRRVDVTEVTQAVLQTVLGQDVLIALAARNAADAGAKLSALDNMPPRASDPLPEDKETLMWEAEAVAKRQILRKGLVSPAFEDLQGITDIYNNLLHAAIIYFSQRDVVFPKRLTWQNERGSAG